MWFENGRCWWTFVFKTAPLRFLRRLSPSKLYFQSSFKCHTKAPLRFHWSSCQDLCSWRLWGPTYSWSIFVLRFFKTNKTMNRTTNAFEHIRFLKTTLELDQKPSSICNVIFRSVVIKFWFYNSMIDFMKFRAKLWLIITKFCKRLFGKISNCVRRRGLDISVIL